MKRLIALVITFVALAVLLTASVFLIIHAHRRFDSVWLDIFLVLFIVLPSLTSFSSVRAGQEGYKNVARFTSTALLNLAVGVLVYEWKSNLTQACLLGSLAALLWTYWWMRKSFPAQIALGQAVQFTNQKQYANAIAEANKARDGFIKARNRGGLASAETQLGAIRTQQAIYPSAADHYSRALALFQADGNHKQAAPLIAALENFRRSGVKLPPIPAVESIIPPKTDWGFGFDLALCLGLAVFLIIRLEIVPLQADFKVLIAEAALIWVFFTSSFSLLSPTRPGGALRWTVFFLAWLATIAGGSASALSQGWISLDHFQTAIQPVLSALVAWLPQPWVAWALLGGGLLLMVLAFAAMGAIGGVFANLFSGKGDLTQPGWVQKSQAERAIKAFNALAAKDEPGSVPAALTLYEKYLAKVPGQVPAATQACYHFLRWEQKHEKEDLDALNALGRAESSPGTLSRTALQARRMQRQLALAKAVQTRSFGELSGPAEAPEGNAALAYDHLALAVIEVISLSGKSNADKTTHAAQTVNNLLENAQAVEGNSHQAWLLLAYWANQVLGQFSKLVELADQYGTPNQPKGSNADLAVLTILDQWGSREVSAGNINQALKVIAHPRLKQVDPERLGKMILDWGFRALEAGKSAAALEWFTQNRNTLPAGTLLNLPFFLDWGSAISAFACGQLAVGRAILETMSTSQAARSGRSPIAASLSQVEFLQALSWLAETQAWPSPETDPQKGQEALVQNRARWATLRQTLLAGVSKTLQAEGQAAWRSSFLFGLLAYVDKNLLPSEEQIAQFTASLEHVPGFQKKKSAKAGDPPQGLWKIQGELATRSQAAREAARLVKSRDAQALKDLNEQALETLGDTIPGSLRAAVYLTLWENDASYDPLPDLRRIPVDETNEPLINRSITHVQMVQALAKLAQGCASPTPRSDTLPSLASLAEQPDASWLGQIGLAMIQARLSNWDAASHQLPPPNTSPLPELEPHRQFLEFFIAWKRQDVDTCRNSLDAGAGQNRFLKRYGDPTAAVRMLAVMNTLEPGREAQAAQAIEEQFGQLLTPASFTTLVLGLVIWMLEHHYASQAIEMIHQMRMKAAAIPGLLTEKEALSWLLVFLEGMASLQTGRFSASLEAFTNFNGMALPRQTILPGKSSNERLVAWARVLRMLVELAMAEQAGEQLNQRWPSVYRSINQQALALVQYAKSCGANTQAAYASLLEGLVAYLNINTLVDQAVIDQLITARRELNLKKSAGTIEQIISQLILRKKVIEDFWANLNQGNFQESRLIYRNQLEPAFGEKMPHTIRLGMILADWDSATVPTADLLKRLALLEYEAPEIDPGLVKKVKDYILDGDKLRNLTRLVQEKHFDEVVEFVNHTEWAGMERGHMPVPVAIAQLYAFYRTERLEESRNLGEGIRKQLTGWFKDYGLLIYGYSLYRQENYEEAGKIFGEIQTSKLLEHDVDMYWASSHFARGIQLLDVNKRKEAFDAFAHSLQKMKKGEKGLVPLFFQFGYLNLESRNGSRALQSYELSKKTLEDVPPSPAVEISRLQAELGILLCKAMMGQAGNAVRGEEFVKLANRCQTIKDANLAKEVRRLELAARSIAICHELKIQASDLKFKKKAELRDFLQQQLQPIKNLSKEEIHDPVIQIVEAMLELHLKTPANFDKALELLENAARHGATSMRLNELLNGMLKTRQESLERQKDILTQFDLYLANGQVPQSLRGRLVRSDPLMEVYRSKRRYQPEEIVTPEVDSGVESLCKRLEHSVELARNEGLMSPEELAQIQKYVTAEVIALREKEKALRDIEQNIMTILAERLRQQSI